MIFESFYDFVLENLDVDANRRGTEVLRDRSIQNGMADLQRIIPELRPVAGLRPTFIDSDVLVDGWDEQVAECIAEFVKSKLVYRYDDDPGRSQGHWQQFLRLRQQVYLHLKDAPIEATSRQTTLQARQGKTFTYTFEVSRSLTGASIEFTVKPVDLPSMQNAQAPIYISSEVAESGFVMIDEAGTFSITGTANINSVPRYRWDVEITYADGTSEIPEGLQGPYVVLADQTTVAEEEE